MPKRSNRVAKQRTGDTAPDAGYSAATKGGAVALALLLSWYYARDLILSDDSSSGSDARAAVGGSGVPDAGLGAFARRAFRAGATVGRGGEGGEGPRLPRPQVRAR